MMTEDPTISVSRRRRRRIPPLRHGVYILPNLFTTGGLFAGFYSIICTLNGNYDLAAIMILVAQLCDVLDGRIARLTRTTSSFGIQYDSLADLIAFGVAPGILVYQWALVPWGRWGWLAASLYVTCGALRLARFNVYAGVTDKRYFVGLPIPAAAGVVASVVFLLGTDDIPRWLGAALAAGTYLVAILMVTTFRYYSFKEIDFARRRPAGVLVLVVLGVLIVATHPQWFLFVLFFAYALSGPTRPLWTRRRDAVPAPASAGSPPALPADREPRDSTERDRRI